MGISYSDSLDSVPLSYLRLEDMNASSGGVARDTAITSTTIYTDIYSYTGAGHLFSFLVTLEGNLLGADPFNVRLIVDGVSVFELSTLDVATSSLWNLGADLAEMSMGISVVNNTFRFHTGNVPLYFSSSLSISIKKVSGGSKRFRAGMIRLTKEP